jgi:hypothetical protein
MDLAAVTLDLDPIAKRIQLAQEVYGSDFALGTVDFDSGELTARPLVDILRDEDRLALFLEVRRLRLQGPEYDKAITLLREAVDLLTNPETGINLRDWTKAAKTVLKHDDDDQNEFLARGHQHDDAGTAASHDRGLGVGR